ncbi:MULTISPECIES: RHS repeat-associated core domain-containing protein [Burkholderiaceae]|uniref:RHS repeat-associated core domain-containing protein n=1 Tax=Burkholderiaceae TaxID=119060 RepID=UPI00095F096C|nr:MULTISPECIES: RHS repeat-associated core domain-containing protein [Burkholderiaceae]MCG1017850.1 RHS repeat protein [Mycetohabitans sp. B4]SIT67714.1 insecticidal toxin complex protein TccC [Burkholderia sp. b13]
MPETLHSGTPTITVTDNRGLMVRTVQYSREKLGSPLDERITATTYSPAGLVQRQTDPRLFAQSDPSVANFNYGHDLLGHTLWTRSVDAGEHWSVLNSEGQPIAQQDARGTVTRTEYDSLGRLTQAIEQLTGHDPIVLTKLTYGDADNNDPEKKVAAQRANLCGVVSQQCDTAGQLTTPGMTVTGQPQAQLRRLLKATQGDADWGAAMPPDLEIDAYTTAWAYNALGQPLTQIDAISNVQQSTYDVAGRLASVKLKQKQDTNFKTLLASIQYSAQGQLEREAAGNGVTTTYTYDPKTLRLMQSQAKDGNGTVRQQLAYEYDPVGNIVSVEDQAIAPAFFNNEQIQAKATYAYDSLYQLVRATGREQTDAQQSSQLPPLIHPPSPGTRTNYTRTYTYDRSGNLIGICGERGSRFTQNMAIAQGSNRLAAVTGSGLQAGNTISNMQYDANGNPGALGTNVLKQLQWDGRNQLRHVIMLERTGGAPNDEEWYQYDGNGQRVRKTTSTLAKEEDQSQHTDEVIYLPGLQLRRRFNIKNDVVEELHIVTVQAGRAQIRVLHWNKGQPGKIENNQIRYSLDNHLGSSVMELDQNAQLLTYEEYYPYGGTAVWAAKSELEAKYKIIRYSGKERDATGLYYYGFRYYAPWLGRWLNPDPAGTIDGLNLFMMVRNNPISLYDLHGNNSKPFDFNFIVLAKGDNDSYKLAERLFNKPSLRDKAILLEWNPRMEDRGDSNWNPMDDGKCGSLRYIKGRTTNIPLLGENTRLYFVMHGTIGPRDRGFDDHPDYLKYNIVNWNPAEKIKGFHGGSPRFDDLFEREGFRSFVKAMGKTDLLKRLGFPEREKGEIRNIGRISIVACNAISPDKSHGFAVQLYNEFSRRNISTEVSVRLGPVCIGEGGEKYVAQYSERLKNKEWVRVKGNGQLKHVLGGNRNQGVTLSHGEPMEWE